jgi:hypothetical protein
VDKLRLLIALQITFAPLMVHAASQASTITQVGAVKTSMPASSSVASTPSAGAATPATPKPAYQLYTYYGDRYRDPFIPLTGEFRSDQGNDRPPQVSTLLLKGIIQDQKSRVALLTSGISSYILKGGRL